MNEELLSIIQNFNEKGQDFVIGKRNSIKIFSYQNKTINIKSFRIPILINGFIYKYIRKSKAKRSFENANFLLSKGIGTPKPIAFYENFYGIFLRESYYISEHMKPDFVFKDIFAPPANLDLDKILRGIARFSFELHENGIEFLDHTPGNSLVIVDENGNYNFSLVDLNRMNFHENLSLEKRIKNMCRLTPNHQMISVICDEYAKISNQNKENIEKMMFIFSDNFYKRFERKKVLKKKFLFWKK
jgi:Lipopolysaccharide kinase (Kdo/WaaP) family